MQYKSYTPHYAVFCTPLSLHPHIPLSTPLPNPTPCTLPQYATPKPHAMYSPSVPHSQTPRHVLSLSTPLPNPTPCTLPQYPTPKPHSMYSPLNVTVELSHIHTQPIRNNGQNDSRSSLNCNLHVLRQQTERHRILDRIATGTRGVRASVNSSMRAVLIDWCRTQILELHYTFKGYVSCMHVVVFTFILLT